MFFAWAGNAHSFLRHLPCVISPTRKRSLYQQTSFIPVSQYRWFWSSAYYGLYVGPSLLRDILHYLPPFAVGLDRIPILFFSEVWCQFTRSIQVSPVRSSFDVSVHSPGFLLLVSSVSLPGLFPFRRVVLVVLALRGMVDNPSSRKQPNAP